MQNGDGKEYSKFLNESEEIICHIQFHKKGFEKKPVQNQSFQIVVLLI